MLQEMLVKAAVFISGDAGSKGIVSVMLVRYLEPSVIYSLWSLREMITVRLSSSFCVCLLRS